MSEFDLTREVAEKLLLRTMTPFREAIDKYNPGPNKEWPKDVKVELTLEQVREIDQGLGAIGLAMALRYTEQTEMRTAIAVMSAENVRLHGTVETMSELLEELRETAKSLEDALQKARTVNTKLRELTPGNSSFKSVEWNRGG